ncbi:MAG: methyltransferase domain-containing protein [Thermodesulfobacteriota bacterium]
MDASFSQVEMDLVDNPLKDNPLKDNPLKDNLFEVIVCSHVLEHILEDVAAMRELCRVLKPGGRAFLPSTLEAGREATFEDPQCLTPIDRARTFGHSCHVRIYGLDYKDRLEEASFTDNLYICTK